VTQRRFSDIFKQNFHTTPNQYIINYKIDLAKKLLECRELSVLDVAYLCGFEDIYYFSKTFKKVTGQTASNFRKQI
jgi:AraC-like DNA-binding protein